MRRPQSPRAPRTGAPKTSAAEPKPALALRFSRALGELGVSPDSPAAIAVSGGGDSIALMSLFADWIRCERGVFPTILIVDHGLRAQSRAESALVAGWAEADGLAAHVLRWQGAKPKTGIEEKARTARYRLLGHWCAAHRLSTLFLAHTRDDQAETFLLRLGRGSGVDGLSAMRARAPFPVPGFESLRLLRPLLNFGRAELRAYLTAKGAHWLEDPMNEDARFARARIRKALPALEAAGVPATRIAQAARHLARAREALEAATEAFLAAHARFGGDFVQMDGAELAGAHREIGLRALSQVLMRVSGAPYRPRFERLEALFDAIVAGSFVARTLSGCRVGRAPKARAALGPATLLITRERQRKPAAKLKNQP